jgi:hypothetical protein
MRLPEMHLVRAIVEGQGGLGCSHLPFIDVSHPYIRHMGSEIRVFRIFFAVLMVLFAAQAQATEAGWALLREGEHVVLLRHAMAPGVAEPAKVELRTDGVMRSPFAKEYTAASRLYGLVESDLLWAMDMAAMGQPLQSHASARLKRM